MTSQKELAAKLYADFWAWFAQNASSFHKIIKRGDFTEMEEKFLDSVIPHVKAMNEDFTCMVGMIEDDIAELIVTPDGIVYAIPFVEEFIAAAPAIEGWTFTALKPNISDNDEGFGISMADYEFNAQTLSFYSPIDTAYPDSIQIILVHQDFKVADKEVLLHGAFIFLDNYLGELKVVTMIDDVEVSGKPTNGEELIPITKLKSFLEWKAKEVTEKYEKITHSTAHDSFKVVMGKYPDGRMLFGSFNEVLLEWDKTPAYPWIAEISMFFDEESELIQEIDEELTALLPEVEGHLYIGRKTVGDRKDVYFACKDFRKPAFALREFIAKYEDDLQVEVSILKDKYWKAFQAFRKK